MLAAWRSKLSVPAVPLSKIQSDVLSLIAAHRDPESYVAGGTPINLNSPRYSSDIDVFHDRSERIAVAAREDGAILEANGFRISWNRVLPLIYTAQVEKDGESTRLEWVADSDYRFFPTIPDPTFGYVLHPVDLATNKAMAAAGRREVRDIVDLVTVHDTILPLGAILWAAVDKAPGFTPEGLIAEIRRNSNYPKSEWPKIVSDQPIDPDAIMRRVRTILEEAEAFVIQMPTEKAGLLFLEYGKVVQPDPANLETYATHAAQRRGHWPSSVEITAAMLESYRNNPGVPPTKTPSS